MRRVSLFLVILIFPIGCNSDISSADTSAFKFLINDGELTYSTIMNYSIDGLFDPNGISKQFDITSTVTVIVESLSETTVKFNNIYDSEVLISEQERDNITYYPVINGLQYYGEPDILLGTDNSTLDYQIEQYVDKTNGDILSVVNPLNSERVIIVSYYDSTSVDSYLWLSHLFDLARLCNVVFNVDVVNYPYDDSAGGVYMTTEEGEYQGRKTWIAEYHGLSDEISTSIRISEYDQESGLLVKSILEYKDDLEHYLMINYLTSGIDLVDDGDPVVQAEDDITVNSFDPITITFNVIENYFSSYTFYQNGIVYETSDEKLVLSFIITPTIGITSYTLEIIDQLGYTGNATINIIYDESYVDEDLTEVGFLNFSFWMISPIILVFLKKND